MARKVIARNELAKKGPIKKEIDSEILQTTSVEQVSARVKKDLVWVFASVAISLGIGLAVGNFFRF